MKYVERSSTFEEFLQRFNSAISVIPEPDISAEPPVSAQIVGLPRSGTTVLYQLLARTGAVGYPSNVMAFFHQVPWIGAMLQRQLAASDPTLSLTSVAGRTPEPLDPHEFGYFWRRVCGHSGNSLMQDLKPLEPERLQRELDLVAQVFGTPVVYKNFLALAHVNEMRHQMDRMRFISVERDPLDVAASLLEVRRRLAVPDDQLFGTSPCSLQQQPGDVVGNVAQQVVELQRRHVACNFDANADSIAIRYTDLVQQPRTVVADILNFLGVASDRLEMAVPDRLDAGSGVAALSDDLAQALVTALERASKHPYPSS